MQCEHDSTRDSTKYRMERNENYDLECFMVDHLCDCMGRFDIQFTFSSIIFEYVRSIKLSHSSFCGGEGGVSTVTTMLRCTRRLLRISLASLRC